MYNNQEIIQDLKKLLHDFETDPDFCTYLCLKESVQKALSNLYGCTYGEVSPKVTQQMIQISNNLGIEIIPDDTHVQGDWEDYRSRNLSFWSREGVFGGLLGTIFNTYDDYSNWLDSYEEDYPLAISEEYTKAEENARKIRIEYLKFLIMKLNAQEDMSEGLEYVNV